METNSSSYTILRIKRKRDEEVPGVLGKFGSTRSGFRFWVLNVHTLNAPLQYIVIDSAAKKDSKRRKAGLDVFQFAETVSESAWNKLHDEELRVRPITFHYSSPPLLLSILYTLNHISYMHLIEFYSFVEKSLDSYSVLISLLLYRAVYPHSKKVSLEVVRKEE